VNRRITFVLILFGLFWLLLLSRIYFLSIKSNTYYEALAKKNIVNTEYILPVRGMISDRNGDPVALSKLGFTVSLKPHMRTRKNLPKLREILHFISENLPLYETEKLQKRYLAKDTPYNHKPIPIIDFVSYERMNPLFVKFSRYSEITITPNSRRYYPYRKSAAHIIGYVGKTDKTEAQTDRVAKLLKHTGKSGLEKTYNRLLEGEPGIRKVKVNAANKPIETIQKTPPKSSDITLTLDMRLQKKMEKLFYGKTGAAVVMNAKTGAILAAGSYPEYDLNTFVQGISEEAWQKMIKDLNHPFTNKIIRGLYPPGSTVKPLIGLSFLDSKKITEKEKFLCSGALQLGKRKFRCWNRWGHGPTDLTKAIRESCDVYFYNGGLRVGIDKISTDMMRYGFGKKTGIDLPGEFIGTMPSRNWKINKFGEGWYRGETLNTVIGQGNFLSTPIQVARTTAMIASGRAPIPHFLSRVDRQKIDFTTEDLLNDFEKSQLPLIREAMHQVCYHKRGTATKYNSAFVTIAGKTGTSQVIGIPQEEKERMSEEDLKYFQKSHAWLTSFGPFEDPEYVVTVIVEHGGHGGKAAGGIVSGLYNALVNLEYIDKRYVRPEYRILANLPEANASLRVWDLHPGVEQPADDDDRR